MYIQRFLSAGFVKLVYLGYVPQEIWKVNPAEKIEKVKVGTII